jgi:hypothetical protein
VLVFPPWYDATTLAASGYGEAGNSIALFFPPSQQSYFSSLITPFFLHIKNF